VGEWREGGREGGRMVTLTIFSQLARERERERVYKREREFTAHGGLMKKFSEIVRSARKFRALFQVGLAFLWSKFLEKTFLLSRSEKFLTPSGLRPRWVNLTPSVLWNIVPRGCYGISYGIFPYSFRTPTVDG
jgi:hypothetical protein